MNPDGEAGRESKPEARLGRDERVEARVRERAEGGKLPCAVAFRIAEELDVPRLAVGEAADRVGVRISHCQLGCFK